MTSHIGYQLSRRHHGGLIMGLSAVQAGLVALAVGSLILVPTLIRTAAGFAVGTGFMACCALAAFLPVQGRPVHLVLPGLARFMLTKTSRRQRWLAPGLRTANGSRGRTRKPSPAVPATSRGDLPGCLAGLELRHSERPAWATPQPEPVGIVRDSRTGKLSVILSVRGTQFDLLDEPAQHAQLRNWGHVLNQFGRESSPLTRLGWSLWSAPSALIHPAHRNTPTHHTPSHHQNQDLRPTDRHAEISDQGLPGEGPVGNRHDLRVWISIDPTRTSGRRADPALSALAAAQSLTERCQAAGLAVSGPLSPAQIDQAVRLQSDPFTRAGHNPYSPPRQPGTGCVRLVHGAPQSVSIHWDAVSIDGAWHRSFWVSGWPATITRPQWLHPLIHDPAGVRAITVIYEPISLRASRRRITADAVALDSQLQLRHKHDFRIPVHLHHAQADIDQREAELGAGWCEYAHLTLITITAPTRETLDTNSQTLLDQAAQCGITSLQPVNAHHDAAWAISLPLGRAPDHEILTGGRS